MHNFDHTNKYR